MSKHSEIPVLVAAASTRSQGSGTVRETVQLWLSRLLSDAGRGVADEADPAGNLPSRQITRFEERARRMRAEARAAFRSVEGAGPIDGADGAALEAALGVIEAEWQAAVAERDRCAEALKAIRVYAAEPRCRGLAEQGLSGGPVAQAVVAAAFPGRPRFPFLDEPDA